MEECILLITTQEQRNGKILERKGNPLCSIVYESFTNLTLYARLRVRVVGGIAE